MKNTNQRFINATQDYAHAKAFYDIRYSVKAIENSFDKNVPLFTEHLKWYRKQNIQKMFLICDKSFVGYVRISPLNFISIAVKEEECNKGYGTFGLLNIIKLFKNLKAEIIKDNTESIKLFSKFPCIDIEYIEVTHVS